MFSMGRGVGRSMGCGVVCSMGYVVTRGKQISLLIRLLRHSRQLSCAREKEEQ